MKVLPIRGKMSLFYLVVGEGGMILVDAGLAGEERLLWRQMQALGRDDLQFIFITHAHLDHYGAALAIRAKTGARIVVHEADAAALAGGETPLGTVRSRGRLVRPLLPLAERWFGPPPTPADVLVQDGASFAVGEMSLQVVHTPGHTPGSCTVVVNGEHAFVGDLISGLGRPHIQRYYAHDWAQLPLSVQCLRALPGLRWLYPGHGRTPLPPLPELR
ncbi:MAG: MBL fold metallo-hydrolase [Chloroflexi bacterium]|nr:MBL fold metallo-hydrolase [Chloroflexota bacterium]